MTAPVFPYAPADLAVEMYLGSTFGWVDVTSDVFQRDPIRISGGRSNEKTGSPAPSSCQLTLDNRTGKYSMRNPTGPYFDILGRNTPLRVARRTAKDTFTGRTVSNGWGTAEVGGAWSIFSGSASNYAVASGVATHTTTATVAFKLSYLASQTYRDVELAATVSVPFSNVTGGTLDLCSIVLSGLSTSDYFMVTLRVSTAEVLTMSIAHVDGTVIVADTVTGITFSGQALRVRAHLDGHTLRGKVWATSGVEPFAWNVEGRSTRFAGRAAGWVGVRSMVNASNTNIPVTFSFDDVEVREYRYSGEIAEFPSEWDVSGEDVYVPIVASGPRRRIGQGEAPLQSTYLRGNKTISPAHIAYWPVEDGSGATSIASGLMGAPLAVTGSPQFATNTDFVGSAPIAKPNNGIWQAQIAGAAATGQLQVVFLISVPSTGELDQAAVIELEMSGTLGFCHLVYNTGGSVKLKFYNQNRVLVHTSGNMGFGLDGQPLQISIELTQSGGDVGYVVAVLAPGAAAGLALSGTVTTATIGATTGVMVSPYRQVGAAAIGHIAVRNSITSIYTLSDQLKAYAGENARARISRLASENSIALSYVYDGVNTPSLLGTQGRTGLLALLDEAAAADMGTLYESKMVLGMVYRARNSLYNQSAVLALDYSAGHLVPPFKPIEDDQNLTNDETVTRTNGSSWQAVQLTGRLAVTAPSVGMGVGRYNDAVTLNYYADDQVRDAAGWLLHLGTVDEPRYPQITVDLAKLAAKPATASLAMDALAVGVDDRITIANPKTPTLAPDLITLLARGYTEELRALEHTIVFQCAPESPWEVLQLDTAGLDKLDAADSVLAAAVSSSATTMVVASPTGQVWTVDAAAWPIPLRISGETISATAVANENLSNVGFESGLSPWTGNGGTASQSSTQKHSGTFAAKMIPDGVSAQDGFTSESLPVVANGTITVTGWAWFTSAHTSKFTLSVNWFDAAAAYISTASALVSASATTWTQVTNTFTVPANAFSATVVPTLTGTPAAAQVWYLDDVSFTGPQRLTVTRSVNGVVKAQAALAAISLARPATLAM